jgi:deoxycytidine triphosphate deaminase
MNLTGKQLIEKGIITGEIRLDNVQPNGVDLNLVDVMTLDGVGMINCTEKTKLAERSLAPTMSIDEKQMWKLSPGTYELIFEQGCKVPPDQRLFTSHRSSVVRNGAFIISGIYDGGFETDHIGAMLVVTKQLLIEVGARVGVAFTDVVNEVDKEDLYVGQWKDDNQRKDFPKKRLDNL